MKRRMTLSLMLTLSMALSLASFSTAQGQQQRRRPVAVTGVFTLGAGQVLRITVVGGGGSDTITIRFGWRQFVGGNCTAVMGGTVCRHTVASEGTSAPVMIGRNEAASLDIDGNGNGVQVMVFFESRMNDGDPIAQMLAQIIDSQGNVVASEDISQPG
ncbi:MAG: hypothetical protein ACJ74W_14135 [Pyrinomonadaceae bacterium]